MTQRDKTFGRTGLPDRLQSVREAVNYFDESPLLRSSPISQAGAEARFRHPPAGELIGADLRGSPMPSQAAPGQSRFGTQNGLLPTDRFRTLMANDRSEGNIASNPRSRDTATGGDRTNAVEKSNRDGTHDIGWSDFGSLLGSLVGNALGSRLGIGGAVGGGLGGYYAGGYGPGLLKETGRAVGRGGFKGDLSGLR